MTLIRIQCPSCNKKGNIEISVEPFKNITRGLLAVNVAQDLICSHSFIAYIDANLQIRDYFIADFKVELPEIDAVEKRFDIPNKDVFNIDLIKLNLSAILLSYVLKSIFYKKRIIIILDDLRYGTRLKDDIPKFFKFITQNTFSADISIITNEIYHKDSKKYTKHMVFEGNKIRRNFKNTINPKKLFVEKNIINKFMTEPDLGFSYIILKNEVQKAYKLTKSIMNFIKEGKDKEINIIKASIRLEDVFKIKIDPVYMNFLIDILRNYYNLNVLSISESFLNSYSK